MANPVEWDAQGKPIQSPASGGTEWDASGNPIGASTAPSPAGLPDGQSLPRFNAHPAIAMTPSLLGRDAGPKNTLANVVTGAAKSIPGTIAGAGKYLTIGKTPEQATPIYKPLQDAAQTHGTAQAIGKGIGNAAQFLIPGMGEEAAGAKLAEFAPKLGEMAAPIARMGAQTLGSGAVNKAQGGNFSTGAAGGAFGAGAGEAMRAASPALAETALRVRGNDRLFGRTVGRAILDDTSGVRPETVASSARNTLSQITPELESRAAAAGAGGSRGSLIPARQGVAETVGNHLTNRAVDSAAELEPLQSRLSTDAVTNLPLAAQQSPTGLLNMKRGLNSDFISNWTPEQKPGLRASARQAYGAINDEFHNAVPGAAELDQRTSSLIPVAKRAEGVSNNAGVVQRTAGRLMAHTGAATLGGLGAAGGYKEGGIPGAIAGGLTGIVAPELISSPTAQMIAARTMNNPRLLVPAVGGALQLTKKDNQ